jgi:deoxyadenosine/deoxycytidine kinase
MRIVEIAGPTGSGKTTLIRQLTDISRAFQVVHELSADQIHGSSRKHHDWSETQRDILQFRASQLKHTQPASTVLADRYFSEDREVFFTMHRELGHITDDQRTQLDGEALRLEDAYPTACIIYLQASPPVLSKRMIIARQPEWVVTNLGRQLELYAHWLAKRPHSVILDSSESTPSILAHAAFQALNVRGLL